jgi:hypothetical protein
VRCSFEDVDLATSEQESTAKEHLGEQLRINDGLYHELAVILQPQREIDRRDHPPRSSVRMWIGQPVTGAAAVS